MILFDNDEYALFLTHYVVKIEAYTTTVLCFT